MVAQYPPNPLSFKPSTRGRVMKPEPRAFVLMLSRFPYDIPRWLTGMSSS